MRKNNKREYKTQEFAQENETREAMESLEEKGATSRETIEESPQKNIVEQLRHTTKQCSRIPEKMRNIIGLGGY